MVKNKTRNLSIRRSRSRVPVTPIDDNQLEEAEDRADLKAARAAIREIKRKGTIPWTQVKKGSGAHLIPGGAGWPG